ncbi:hypothetical protein M8494_04710 [Serratia ureilytica]
MLPFLWGAPASTSEVEALLRAVQSAPGTAAAVAGYQDWLIQHRAAVGLSLALLALLIVNHIWIALLVRADAGDAAPRRRATAAAGTGWKTRRQPGRAGEMASGFAHELNQPLAAIRHYAQGA